MSRTTIRDIAKALNIAPSTVSSCLNGDTSRRISPERIKQVQQKAEEMGYIPNILASRIFRRNNKKLLGIIVKNDSAISSTQNILNVMISELSKHKSCDYSILFAAGDSLTETLRNGVGLGINDFIVTGYLRGDDLKKIDFRKLPTAIRIYAANYYFDATDIQIPQIAKKIGFARDDYYTELKNYLESKNYGPVTVVRALEEGQPPPQGAEHIFYQVKDIRDLFQFGSDIIAPQVIRNFRNAKCRTLLLRNDSLAIGVIETLLKENIRIPDDIAVIGFNNAPFAPYAKVPLSSISYSGQDNILNLLEHILNLREIPDIIRQQPMLILRDSVPRSWDWSEFKYPVKSEF